MRFRQGRVRSVAPLGGDIWHIEIEPADGQPLSRFDAGAHIELEITREIIRPYSLCGPPGDPETYHIGVLRDPSSRGGSEAICTQWKAGRRIRFSEPRNLFPLNDAKGQAIFIGAGVGITPMVAMAYELLRRGSPFTMHYCARSLERAAFLPELKQFVPPGVMQLHFSQVKRFSAADDLGTPAPDGDIYVCGPEGFIADVVAGATEVGWAPERIHQEHFDVSTDVSGGAFDVIVGREILQVPEGRSIAQILIESGHEVELSCEKGICGSCVAKVAAGTPDHRDHYLTDDEKCGGQLIALCCSRAMTPSLTLELEL